MASKDMYANMLAAKVIIADDTISGVEINLGISLGQKKGILIDRIDYFMNEALASMIADKGITAAWSISPPGSLSEIEIDNKSIIHYTRASRVDDGTPGNSVYNVEPYVYELTPPIILASPQIYFLSHATASSGSNGTYIRSRMSYRYIDISTQEYLELAESFLLVG